MTKIFEMPMEEREMMWIRGYSYQTIADFFETDVFTEKYLHYEYIKQEL